MGPIMPAGKIMPIRHAEKPDGDVKGVTIDGAHDPEDDEVGFVALGKAYVELLVKRQRLCRQQDHVPAKMVRCAVRSGVGARSQAEWLGLRPGAAIAALGRRQGTDYLALSYRCALKS